MLSYPYKVKRSSQIVVPFVAPAAGVSFQVSFPDQPYLRGRKIVAITACSNIQLDNANFNILYSFDPTKPIFATFTNNKNEQFVQNIPIPELYATGWQQASLPTFTVPVNTNGIILFEPTEIVWPKSYLYFPNAIASPGSTVSAVFTIYYI